MTRSATVVPRVYVPNDAGHDMSRAEEFGEVVYLTRGPVNRLAVRDHCKAIRRGLRASKPTDYVVVGGLSILTAIAAGAFAAKHGRVNFLIWEWGRYVEKQAELLPTAA